MKFVLVCVAAVLLAAVACEAKKSVRFFSLWFLMCVCVCLCVCVCVCLSLSLSTFLGLRLTLACLLLFFLVRVIAAQGDKPGVL